MSEQSIPTFMAGDVVTVSMELVHSMNVADAQVTFVHETEPTELRGRFEESLTYEPQEVEEGASLLTFELDVDAQYLHGEYRLQRLLVVTGGGVELVVDPIPDIRFRIEPENTHVLRVRQWGLRR